MSTVSKQIHSVYKRIVQVSPGGSRCLRRWIAHPLVTKHSIDDRLQAVDALMLCIQGRCCSGSDSSCTAQENLKAFRAKMKELPDTERLLSRLSNRRISPTHLQRMLSAFRDLEVALRSLKQTTRCTAATSTLFVGIVADPILAPALSESPGSMCGLVVAQELANLDAMAVQTHDKANIIKDLGPYPELATCKQHLAAVERKLEDHLKDLRVNQD